MGCKWQYNNILIICLHYAFSYFFFLECCQLQILIFLPCLKYLCKIKSNILLYPCLYSSGSLNSFVLPWWRPSIWSLILMISLFLSESSNEFLVSLVSRATRQQYRRKCWCFNQPKICYPVMWRPLRLAFHQSILIFSLFASLFSPKNDLHFGRQIIITNAISIKNYFWKKTLYPLMLFFIEETMLKSW